MKKLVAVCILFSAISAVAQSAPSSKDAVNLAIQWSQEARQSPNRRTAIDAKYQTQATALLGKLDASRKSLVKSKKPGAKSAALDTSTTNQFTHVSGLHELVLRAWYLQSLEQQAAK